MMGVAPLAIVEFFCRSPAQRQALEAAASSFLAEVPEVLGPQQEREFVEKLIENPSALSRDEFAAKLHAQFLMVSADSCYGRLSIFDASMGRPDKEDWVRAECLCVSLLERGLCSSVMLRQGCERKGFFGKRTASAIVAPPDFAKLAVLKRLERLDASRLHAVVEGLDALAKHERYCEDTWQALAAACEADHRFASVLSTRR